MSEEILRIFLEDLETVRIVCKSKDCGRVYEMPIAKLAEGAQDLKCVCGVVLRKHDKAANQMNDFFTDLAMAVHRIKNFQAARCEFVLPVKHDKGSTQS